MEKAIEAEEVASTEDKSNAPDLSHGILVSDFPHVLHQVAGKERECDTQEQGDQAEREVDHVVKN